jgi:hypothetical protein
MLNNKSPLGPQSNRLFEIILSDIYITLLENTIYNSQYNNIINYIHHSTNCIIFQLNTYIITISNKNNDIIINISFSDSKNKIFNNKDSTYNDIISKIIDLSDCKLFKEYYMINGVIYTYISSSYKIEIFIIKHDNKSIQVYDSYITIYKTYNKEELNIINSIIKKVEI